MPNQQQLIEQVVLEPEHYFVALAPRLEDRIGRAVLFGQLVGLHRNDRIEVAAAGPDPLFTSRERRRPVVQNVWPRAERTGYTRLLHRRARSITVENVENIRHR